MNWKGKAKVIYQSNGKSYISTVKIMLCQQRNQLQAIIHQFPAVKMRGDITKTIKHP